MSEVTNIIFTFPIGEVVEDTIDKINDYTMNNYSTSFVSIDDSKLPNKWYGGYKYFEAELYIAAINGFDKNSFLEFIKKLKWQEPEYVQLIIKEEESRVFEIKQIID